MSEAILSTTAPMTEAPVDSNQQVKLTLYWLDKSRSHRILWLLEELKLQYEIKIFKRGKDMLAPSEGKDIHPLGKFPILAVQAPGQSKPRIIAESGFIVEYLLEHFGKQFIPTRYAHGDSEAAGTETEEWMRYRYYLHYSEGSLMPFLILKLVVGQIRSAPVPFFIKPITKRVADQIETGFLSKNIKSNVAFLEEQLATSPGTGEWFCGSQLTGADFMMIFPLEAGQSRIGITAEKTPKLAAWIKRCLDRDAYKAATKKIEDLTGAPMDAKL